MTTKKTAEGLVPSPPMAMMLQTDSLALSGFNPREVFDPIALGELAESIKAVGILQPIVVRNVAPGKSEILCGERRWRAAQIAGLADVPCMVYQGLDDTTAKVMAATENLARRDMSDWETLRAYRALRDAGLKVGEIASKAGVGAASVTKLLAVEKLPEAALDLFKSGTLSLGAAYQIAQKWQEYPAAALALAKAASANVVTVRDLEEKGVGYSVGRKLVTYDGARDISWDEREAFGCKGCAHFRSTGNSICLDIAAYDRKKAERDTQIKEAEKQRRAELLAARSLPMAEGATGESSAVVKPGEEPSLKISDLKYGEYEKLDVSKRPAGCVGVCPCLADALDYQGKPCLVCLDRKRYQNLQKKDTQEKNKQTKAAALDGSNKIVALRCFDPDTYYYETGDDEQKAEKNALYEDHEWRRILSLGIAIRELIAHVPVASKRLAVGMLPTAAEIAAYTEIPLDQAQAHYDRLKAFFEPAGTNHNTEQAFPGLLSALSSIQSDLHDQVLLAAVGAIGIGELAKQADAPDWYKPVFAPMLLGGMPELNAAETAAINDRDNENED
jgi:ParB family transcriptional regulator, chromosome partitioning protein